MRVGFDAKRAFNNRTGLGNYSRFVLNALAASRSGSNYLAYTPRLSNGLFNDFAGETVLPASGLDRKLSAYWRYTRVVNQLRTDRIDVFHGLSNELPQGLKEAGIGSVVTIHDLIFERLPQLFNPVDRWIYRAKFKSACARADAVIAISEQTKRDLIALYGIDEKKIRIIYQDCNPLFKIPVASETKQQIADQYGIRKPYILCVGTLEERKNQLRLTQAFCQLGRNEFQLVLIGKATPYTQQIRNFIKENKLEKRVLVLENVPTAHLSALYQQAEVFAYISVYEGFGIPILEALHSGIPVLAARGSCLEEAGGPGGLYADASDVDDISLQLKKLISDKPLRTSLVQAGQKYIQRFEGRVIANELEALYEEVYARNKKQPM